MEFVESQVGIIQICITFFAVIVVIVYKLINILKNKYSFKY